MNNENILEVSHLSKHFKTPAGKLFAVNDVSFAVRRGEIFGLVGESGCGKTTLGRTLMGIYDVTDGQITLDGEIIYSKNGAKKSRVNRRARRHIQMIFQDPTSSLNPRMTVKEIIAEGLIVNGEKDKKKISDQVSQILELVGLSSEHATRYPHEFSGGQRQRIGIARALIVHPELLIADEPISALDVSIQAQIINLLSDLREGLGLTVLFIAHDLSVVKYFCDRVGVMYKGRIVELASSDELFLSPLHPYTRSLLSAIPIPDPHKEKSRQRIIYEHCEECGDEELREITLDHFVFCTKAEADKLTKEKIK